MTTKILFGIKICMLYWRDFIISGCAIAGFTVFCFSSSYNSFSCVFSVVLFFFLVACTRLYKSLFRSVGPSVMMGLSSEKNFEYVGYPGILKLF